MGVWAPLDSPPGSVPSFCNTKLPYHEKQSPHIATLTSIITHLIELGNLFIISRSEIWPFLYNKVLNMHVLLY